MRALWDVWDVATACMGPGRRSERTAEALDLLIEALSLARRVVWILDSPVSDSGRLAVSRG